MGGTAVKTINALGKPCPIPVIETKKTLAIQEVGEVLTLVDNLAAVQNLEKMANGYGYGFSCVEIAKDSYEVDRKSVV
jgi:TusA-related sulfurtransferase